MQNIINSEICIVETIGSNVTIIPFLFMRKKSRPRNRDVKNFNSTPKSSFYLMFCVNGKILIFFSGYGRCSIYLLSVSLQVHPRKTEHKKECYYFQKSQICLSIRKKISPAKVNTFSLMKCEKVRIQGIIISTYARLLDWDHIIPEYYLFIFQLTFDQV